MPVTRRSTRSRAIDAIVSAACRRGRRTRATAPARMPQCRIPGRTARQGCLRARSTAWRTAAAATECNTSANVDGSARTFSTNGALSATDTMPNRAAALERLMTGAVNSASPREKRKKYPEHLADDDNPDQNSAGSCEQPQRRHPIGDPRQIGKHQQRQTEKRQQGVSGGFPERSAARGRSRRHARLR